MIGSSAVTMPLAGTCTTGRPSAPRLWMYGSRFETTIICGESRLWRTTCASAFGVQFSR